jgi:hypothetical protein
LPHWWIFFCRVAQQPQSPCSVAWLGYRAHRWRACIQSSAAACVDGSGLGALRLPQSAQSFLGIQQSLRDRRARWQTRSEIPYSRGVVDVALGSPCHSGDERYRSRLWLGGHVAGRCRARSDPNGRYIPPRPEDHVGMSARSWWRHGAHTRTPTKRPRLNPRS